MLTGRPRKACAICKSQKIRCTGEKPSCRRCSRLKHTCIYNDAASAAQSDSQQAQDSERNSTRLWSPPTSQRQNRSAPTDSPGPSATSVLLRQLDSGEQYLGIPKALLITLIDLYFGNVYNAELLLHRRSFLEQLALGTARPHIILGICAWAANFYRNANGQATLKDQGFMAEWAQRAGRLAFQDIHEFHDDTLVTLVNLSIFWHSQGSWRVAMLHKGTACNLLSIIGGGPTASHQKTSCDSEMRRRRCWAVYLMHCHNGEPLSTFPVTDTEDLVLPWPEAHFEAGYSTSNPVTLASGQSNGGVYAELIKIFSLWSSVSACLKTTEASLGRRLPAMYALHERLSSWWQKLPIGLRLTPTSVATMPEKVLPNILLMNVVYHQSLCALHASIVPLFCWGNAAEDNEGWSTARRLSAQLAYEHACTISGLLAAVMSICTDLSAMPSFICYGAYCGCAIQIPFIWSSNRLVREKACNNVEANMKVINTMSTFWRYAAILKVYVHCLYSGHKARPTILEDEPTKCADSSALDSFDMKAPHVQASILEFIAILRSNEDGYAGSEEGPVLEIQRVHVGEDSAPQASAAKSFEEAQDSFLTREENQCEPLGAALSLIPESLVQYRPNRAHQHQHQLHSLQSAFPAQYQPDILPNTENQTVDVFQPLLDPDILDLFPGLPDLSAFDSDAVDWDHFEMQ